MQNKYLMKILQMVDNINNLIDIDEKKEAIYRLSSYCAYVYYCGYITEKEYLHSMMKIVDDPEEKEYEKGRNDAIEELINNNSLLNKFYKDYVDVYNNNFIPQNIDYEFNISIYKLFYEFLKYMNCEKIYNSLLAKKNISFHSIIDHSICVNNRDDSYIIICEDNPFDRYFTFSHEIAHAYENNVMRDYKSYFDIGYNAEIISILFNRIFMEFIFNNQVLTKNQERLLINRFEINYYNFLLQSLFITEIVGSKKYSILDYELCMTSKNMAINCSLTDHNYAIGSTISLNLLNKWRNNDRKFIQELPELIKSIRNMKLNELINTFDDKNIITAEIKRLIKSK